MSPPIARRTPCAQPAPACFPSAAIASSSPAMCEPGAARSSRSRLERAPCNPPAMPLTIGLGSAVAGSASAKLREISCSHVRSR